MRDWSFIEKLLKSGVCEDPSVIALLKRYIADPSKENSQALYRRADPVLLYHRLFGKPFQEPDDRIDGQIRFARTEQGIYAGINLDEPHCLIAGQTGCGKTYLLLLLLGQAL